MRDVNIEEFNNLVKNQKDSLEIIDVREPDEFKIIKFRDSKLIPMLGVENRQNEIDWSKTVVFICRTGARSGHIARGLPDKETLNLVGGLKACYENEMCHKFLEFDRDKLENYF